MAANKHTSPYPRPQDFSNKESIAFPLLACTSIISLAVNSSASIETPGLYYPIEYSEVVHIIFDMASHRKAHGELQAPGKPAATNSSTRRTITEFLESKIHELTGRRLALLAEQDELIERKEDFPESEFQKRLCELLGQISPATSDIQAITRSKRFLEQDIEEQLEQQPAKRSRSHPPDTEFFERAYAKSLIPRVMGTSAHKSMQYNRHDQGRFRENVLGSYEAIINDQAYCCVSGMWFPKSQIKAAHLVPKTMTPDEIFYLFGAGEDTARDPKNGIPLHSVVKRAIDSGILAVVPKELLGSNQWQTVLVDKSRANMTAYQVGGEKITQVYWRDFENKELKFPSTFRPARRYLYFRFVITYLHAKSMGNRAFTDTVEFKRSFWASGGQWINKSTLGSLARNVSGVELPDSIKENTFTDLEMAPEQAALSSEISAKKVTEAVAQSLKAQEEYERNG